MTEEPKKLKPHGTIAAFMRHKRAGDEPCAACREASRKNTADYRARKKKEAEEKKRATPRKVAGGRLTVEPVKQGEGETVIVKQLVAYGQAVEVEVPVVTDPGDILDELLLRARATLQVAPPRDVPGLISAAVNVLGEQAKIMGEKEQETPARSSLVDELAKVRAAREARAAAGGA